MGIVQERKIERHEEGEKMKQRKSECQPDQPLNFIEGKSEVQRRKLIWIKFCCWLMLELRLELRSSDSQIRSISIIAQTD